MLKDQKLLARIAAKKAIIISDGTGNNNFVALPNGDKRRRPIAWLDKEILGRLLASGAVQAQGEVFVLVPSYKNRLKAANENGEKASFSAQHHPSQTRDIYNPDGLERTVSIRGGVAVFRRLAGYNDKEGNPFLNAHEIEAGERFAHDYARSMMGSVATQSYSDVNSGKAQENTAENMSIMAMDARKSVMDAMAELGPGLDNAMVGICGREWNIGQLESSEGWPKGTGKTILKLALGRLSDYYGCRPGQGAKRSAR